MQERDIGSAKGLLDTFLVEPFVAHTEEYYLAIKTERDADVIYFSATGGVDIEEEWDGVKEVRVGLLENLDKEVLRSTLAIDDDALIAFINQFFAFFRMYGFAYLEVNPFVVNTQGQVVCLDMVARVDTCEAWKQKGNWKDIIRTKAFGSQTSLFEQEVERMDAETGASLKFVTCNPQGSI
jgi:succinyl-CoA synthetase beta subunit